MYNKYTIDNTIFKVAIYIRLSREDGDDLESESVTNQRSLLIGYLKEKDQMSHVKKFIPKINNWAVCDLFCSTLKEAQRYPQEYWQMLMPYFNSTNAYDLRFASVMLLNHFTGDEFAEEALNLLKASMLDLRGEIFCIFLPFLHSF